MKAKEIVAIHGGICPANRTPGMPTSSADHRPFRRPAARTRPERQRFLLLEVSSGIGVDARNRGHPE